MAPTLADLVVPFVPVTCALNWIKETKWLYDGVMRFGDFCVKAVGLQLGEARDNRTDTGMHVSAWICVLVAGLACAELGREPASATPY